MDRNGSLRCAAQSFPISSRRSESATPRSRRVRSRRSRTAFVTASAMLSPVSLASWCASLCAYLFLMLRLIKEPFYHHSLPCYLYNGKAKVLRSCTALSSLGCCSTVANRLRRVEGSPDMVFLPRKFSDRSALSFWFQRFPSLEFAGDRQ